MLHDILPQLVDQEFVVNCPEGELKLRPRMAWVIGLSRGARGVQVIAVFDCPYSRRVVKKRIAMLPSRIIVKRIVKMKNEVQNRKIIKKILKDLHAHTS